MSSLPNNDEGRSDETAEGEALAMKDQLRKDVANWSAARSEGSARQTGALDNPVGQPASQPAKRAKRPAKPASSGSTTEAGGKKPFRMSYDGVANAEYITYMITRGAR